MTLDGLEGFLSFRSCWCEGFAAEALREPAFPHFPLFGSFSLDTWPSWFFLFSFRGLADITLLLIFFFFV